MRIIVMIINKCCFVTIFYRFCDIMCSCRELDSWTQDFVLPAVVWLSGLFNPQSFLTGEIPVGELDSDLNEDYISSMNKHIYCICSCAPKHRT